MTIWVWLCAHLNCAGWTLSWLHQLNAGGYAVALALGLGAMHPPTNHDALAYRLLRSVHWLAAGQCNGYTRCSPG